MFFEENEKGLERLLRFKQWKLLRPFLKKDKTDRNENGGKPKSFLYHLFHF